jgi:leader peptidase (prepilin peptidase)/N-methyltransferase
VEIVWFLQENTIVFLSLIFVFGLLIGSFLNVVIYRLPLIMEQQWKTECQEFLEIEPDEDSSAVISLSTPASSCRTCGHEIRAWENIPVISYLLLKGRCSNCNSKISIRYPLIELAAGLASLAIAMHFGFSWSTLLGLVLTYALIALSMIDFDHQILPDNIIYPVLWLGLLISIPGLLTDMQSALIGAAAGYLSLWSVFWLFKLLTGKEGMGHGDFKLLALFGAWLGWQYLPQIILLSSLVGAIIGISLMIFLGRDRNIPIPFGPYLAIAGWISLLYGEEINSAYLQFAGIN